MMMSPFTLNLIKKFIYAMILLDYGHANLHLFLKIRRCFNER